PMYVSIHATDPVVRGHLLGRKGPVGVLEKLDFLISKGISIHTQVVYCPGLNDGAQLDRTITDLADRYPHVVSLGVVPLGLTKFRQNLPKLASVTQLGCKGLLEQIHEHQDQFLSQFGSRFVYAGDEIYLQSGLGLPLSDRYDGFPLIENGIGMVRRFLDNFEYGFPSLISEKPTGSVSLVTGMLGEGFVAPLADRLNTMPGFSLNVIPVANEFLGTGITVSGLLAGQDILATLKRQGSLGDRILLPPNCVNHEGILLDDLSPYDLSRELGKSIEVGSYSLIDSIRSGSTKERPVESSLEHPYIASHQLPEVSE
ncbi:MAG: DUF512 domain-containing protein, partial [Candidatus Latescibacterota bacterium]|nr:DUF512 domain-containing protein [Candidatus Latescibacterota bacterium]